ncbi:MAG: Nif3-like dinuclear metal center hexameric protein [Actinobacteria bacterium]|nr:Nif3-like dinuclear metal center hexameric protein [Actinomycetota bacterium]
MSPVEVRRIVEAIHESFPSHWAEPWDKFGLICGDPCATVTGVFVTLDPTAEAIAATLAAGANVVATHHPAFLEPQTPIAAPGSRGIAWEAARHGVSLIAAHTNLDRAPAGAGALGATLGLPSGEPLERSMQSLAHISVFVPSEAADTVRAAMTEAGAGRIGEYEGCSFTAEGTGRFLPLAGASPCIGTIAKPSRVPEERIEAVCDPTRADWVVARIVEAHPYEEPLVVVTPVKIARGSARLGRICTVEPVKLEDLAADVASRMDCTPRVWGKKGSRVTRVATASGSAGALLPDAIAVAADVLIAGEVRYHDALEAVAQGVCVIEVGHDVSEWPLVPVLAGAIRNTPGLDSKSVTVDSPTRRWWLP